MLAGIYLAVSLVGLRWFEATIPPGLDEDGVGGTPFLLVLGLVLWLVLLPAASVLSFAAWWAGERWVDAVLCLLAAASVLVPLIVMLP